MLFEDSDNTKRILEYFKVKYGESLMAIGLAKSLSVASLKVKECFPLNIVNVSPAGHFKSRTSIEQVEIFGKRNIINFGSDFTIHGLAEQYDKGRGINNKTCLINDLTLLFGSKSKQAKERLINALAEMLSEGSYAYKNFKENWEMKARISLIGNITIETYMKYYKELLESTFGERCLTLYNVVERDEEASFNKEKRERIAIDFGDKVKLKSRCVDYSEYNDFFVDLAKKWQILNLSPSQTRVFDRVVSVAKSNAVLNGRGMINDDDLAVLGIVQKALINPLSPHVRIVELAVEGLSQSQICQALGKNPESYQGYVSRVLSSYKQRGVIKHDEYA